MAMPIRLKSRVINVNLSNLPTSVLNELLNLLQDAVFAIADGQFIFVNKQACLLFSYDKTEILGNSFTQFIHTDDISLVMQRYQARLRGEDVPSEYEFRVINKNEEIRDVHLHVGLVTEHDGRVISVGSLKDITEQRNIERKLSHSQADIASILNNMPDVFYRANMQGVITMMSPSCYDAIGYSADEMVGKPMSEFYCSPHEREKIAQAIIQGGGKAEHVEACMLNKDGSKVWVSTNAHIRLDDNQQPMCIEGIARNISDRKAMEEELSKLASLDSLTQSLNRRQFLLKAESQLGIAKRYKRSLTITMMDLDYFKNINDQYGHETGDKALIHFVNACHKLFRRTDLLGRMGGEEFAVLMPESGIEAASEIMQRLSEHLSQQPLVVDGVSIEITFSAGLVSLIKDEDKGLSDLLRAADKLLYQAKDRGRNQVLHSSIE